MSTVDPYQTPQASLQTPSDDVGYDESSAYSADGRFGRAAYIAYSMGLSVAGMLLIAVFGALAARMGDVGGVIVAVISVVVYIMLIAYSFIFLIRRLHDLNWSGWLSVLSIIPLINLGIYIPALFFRGTEGRNNYGPPRRYVRWHVIAVILLSVASIGILAAIAIPAYQDYVQRAQQAAMQQP